MSAEGRFFTPAILAWIAKSYGLRYNTERKWHGLYRNPKSIPWRIPVDAGVRLFKCMPYAIATSF